MGENKMRNNDYQKDLEFIRSHLEKMEKPEPSYNFFEETRNLCHSKLPSIKSPRVPKSVWIAFALNVILIGLLMIPLVKSLKAGLPLSPPALSALILLILIKRKNLAPMGSTNTKTATTI
jgi:hypothetical protein